MRLTRRSAVWPAVAWAAALLAVTATAAASGYAPFSPSTWSRWDSAHYLSIASHGYDAHPCVAGEIANARPGDFCGNAAWFPGYPWAIAALHWVGIPLVEAALVLAWTFSLVALILLWQLLLRDLPVFEAAVGLAYAAFAPGQIYDYAVFPISLFLAFEVAFLAALRRERWLVAGLAAFGAALTYPIGVLALPFVAAAVVVLVARAGAAALAASALPPLAGFAVVTAVQRLQTGRWSAFFRVQRHYAHGIHDPIGVTWNYVLLLARSGDPFRAANAGAWIVVVGTVVVALAAIRAVQLRSRLDRADVALVIWALATWAIPLTQANVSVWRSQAALAPLGVAVAKLPRALALACLAAAVVIAVAAARLFIMGRLV